MKKLFFISLLGFVGAQVNAAMNDECHREQAYSIALRSRFEQAVKSHNRDDATKLLEEIKSRRNMAIVVDSSGGFIVGFSDKEVDDCVSMMGCIHAQHRLPVKSSENDYISSRDFFAK